VADPRYLLDTNVCIRVLAGTAPATVAWLESLSIGEAVVSAITYAEYLRGHFRRRARTEAEAEQQATDPDRMKARQFFQQIPVLAFGEDAALRYGLLHADRSLPGRLRADWLIAAHAICLHCVLVTADRGFTGLHPRLEVHQLDDIEAGGQWP
jgi:tRNA(fMet)-specific endonuclease VapC